MHFHNFYIKMYMRVFCMASVLHHTSFLTTRLAFKLRGLLELVFMRYINSAKFVDGTDL